MSTLGSCHGLDEHLCLSDTSDVVLLSGSPVRLVISMVSWEWDAVDVLAVSATVGSCGSTQD